MTKRDYYDILGVPKGASGEDLRKAYRRLAKQYHPDVNKEAGTEERFKEINEAYAVLSDDEKRSAYDRFGHAGVSGNAQDFGAGFGGFSDIFEEFFGGFGGGRTANRRAPRRGADLRYDLDLTFEEAIFGVEKEIEVTRSETCPHCQGSRAEPGTTPMRCPTCKGSGEVRQVRQSFLGSMVSVSTCPTCQGTGETLASPCHACRGSGQVRVSRKRVVSIPPGVDTGTQMRLAGEGEPGIYGGPHGNLYIVINTLPHRYFRRRGNDILLDLSINVAQAALGDEVQVPTVDGSEKLVIPPGTQPGRIFKLKGKGAPILQRSGRGDQIVVVSVHVPTHLTADQKKLFKQLAETMNTDVQPQEKGFLDKLKDVLGG